MAESAAKLTKARILAIAQLIVGFLLICFGIGERDVEELVTHNISGGILAGVWIFITGGLGILGTCKEPSSSRNTFAGLFKGFSIISALFGGGIAGFYSYVIALQKYLIWDERYKHGKPKDTHYDVEVAILAMILILSCIEFVIGIWAAVIIYEMRICCLYSPPPRASSGVPVAVRMQTGVGIVEDQTVTPEAQDNEPQIVLLPDSREVNDLPPSYETVASGYQTLQVDMPPSYEEAEHGHWTTYV